MDVCARRLRGRLLDAHASGSGAGADRVHAPPLGVI